MVCNTLSSQDASTPPTSKNIGDMHWTRSGIYGWTDSAITIYIDAPQSSFGGIKMTFYPGVKGVCKVKIFASMLLYASFPLI